MTTMKLDSRRWTLGNPLLDGKGGFGRVFDVQDDKGNAAVAKFVPKEPGAERELLMGDSLRATKARNVIPVLDTGEYEDQWVIVMPKADRSLKAHLRSADGPLPVNEAVDILKDISTALADLAEGDPAIVHRDLKPGNVLRLHRRWCLADFGIARYAEATTGADTRKWNLTGQYAAPEQWLLERATPAADVYAFGVMAYEMLAGQLPFPGPDLPAFRQQHLTMPAPTLTGGTPRLRALIDECLYKPASARPTAANILARLESVGEQSMSPGASKLAQANKAESDRLARDYAKAVEQAQRDQDRDALFQVAVQSFDSIASPLIAAVEADAPLATIERRAGDAAILFEARLRNGTLGVHRPVQISRWDGPFTVIAHASARVKQSQNSSGYLGREHSLWFCDAQEKARFAWYETAFMNSGFSVMPPFVPFSLDPDGARVAFSNVIGSTQLAWPFEEIDRADPTDFVDRWIEWFADASSGLLHFPPVLPERNPAGSYRHE